MSNLKTLYWFELKKLLQRRTYWIALAVMVLVVLTNELFPVFTGNYAANQVRDRALSGTTLDDTFLNDLKSAENPRSYGLLYDFTVMATQQQDISALDADTMYEKRLSEIEREMTKSKITDGERQYWRTKDAQVAAPYTYAYAGAYAAFFDSVYFINFMVLIMAAVALAGIFADEKTLGTDQLILCTRLGRKALYRVKLFAGIMVSVLSALILLAAELVTAFALYGFDGFDAAFQVFLPATMFSLTIGQASVILMLLLLAVSVFLGVLAVCLSQLTRNHSAATALMIVVMFLSMITPPSSLRVISQLWGMMPGAFCGAWAFYDYHLIGIGGCYLNCLQYTPLFYLLLGGALACLTERVYARSEIKSK